MTGEYHSCRSLSRLEFELACAAGARELYLGWATSKAALAVLQQQRQQQQQQQPALSQVLRHPSEPWQPSPDSARQYQPPAPGSGAASPLSPPLRALAPSAAPSTSSADARAGGLSGSASTASALLSARSAADGSSQPLDSEREPGTALAASGARALAAAIAAEWRGGGLASVGPSPSLSPRLQFEQAALQQEQIALQQQQLQLLQEQLAALQQASSQASAQPGAQANALPHARHADSPQGSASAPSASSQQQVREHPLLQQPSARPLGQSADSPRTVRGQSSDGPPTGAGAQADASERVFGTRTSTSGAETRRAGLGFRV